MDGVPLDAREGANEADRQRCVDVALARADVRVRYDPLEQQPFLNVIAIPQLGVVGKPVRFTSYTNYPRYIDRAEMRLFAPDQSIQQTPLEVIPISAGRSAEWVPPAWRRSLLHLTTSLEQPHYVTYVLRVYDRAGHFDETKPRRMDLTERAPLQTPDAAALAHDTERLAYGENTLVLHDVSTRGGAVTVSGSHVPAGDTVLVRGFPFRSMMSGISPRVRFCPAARSKSVSKYSTTGARAWISPEILTTIAADDSFFVGLADFTAGAGGTSGPINLVSGESPSQTRRDFVNGQLAFYYKGLVKGEWLLTAAADTRDEPVRNLFSNFASKDPQDLLRRFDPNSYYPVYGDDSTTVQDAPTSRASSMYVWKEATARYCGEFSPNASHGHRFHPILAHPVRIECSLPVAGDDEALGEKARAVDGDPGLIRGHSNPGRNFAAPAARCCSFQNQDISVGSEQVWVQVRDRDSGLVLSVTPLLPAQDYDINYLQGRILLHSPLSATANSTTVVHSGGLDGDPVEKGW